MIHILTAREQILSRYDGSAQLSISHGATIVLPENPLIVEVIRSRVSRVSFIIALERLLPRVCVSCVIESVWREGKAGLHVRSVQLQRAAAFEGSFGEGDETGWQKGVVERGGGRGGGRRRGGDGGGGAVTRGWERREREWEGERERGGREAVYRWRYRSWQCESRLSGDKAGSVRATRPSARRIITIENGATETPLFGCSGA